MLCEAVHSKEPDLWVRFGHMIPMYFPGALYVLKAGKEKEPAIVRYIKEDYVHPHYPQLASCGDRTLLYVSNMMEGPHYQNKPYGRVHLSIELEQRLGVVTLENHRVMDDDVRLSTYCRQDAELCELLVKLDGGNMGQGLCVLAVSHAGADADEVSAKRCAGLPPEDKACAYILWTPSERHKSRECVCRLRKALGLRLIADCIN